MLYGTGTVTVAVKGKQEAKLEVAELRMLRFASGTRNECIRGKAKVVKSGKQLQQSRLRWHGHLLRGDKEYVGRRIIVMESLGRKKIRVPKKRYLNLVKEHMHEMATTVDDGNNRGLWRRTIYGGSP